MNSGVAGAFYGERAAYPEDQNEEENEENLRKKENLQMEEWAKTEEISCLAQPRVKGWLRPCKRT